MKIKEIREKNLNIYDKFIEIELDNQEFIHFNLYNVDFEGFFILKESIIKYYDIYDDDKMNTLIDLMIVEKTEKEKEIYQKIIDDYLELYYQF